MQNRFCREYGKLGVTHLRNNFGTQDVESREQTKQIAFEKQFFKQMLPELTWNRPKCDPIDKHSMIRRIQGACFGPVWVSFGSTCGALFTRVVPRSIPKSMLNKHIHKNAKQVLQVIW